MKRIQKTISETADGPGGDVFREIDFGELYREQCRRSSYGSRTSADWDGRAARRRRQVRDSDYNEAFLSRLNLTGVRTALDIGCGTGNLAIPLARRLTKVHALDFSPEMLRQLERERRRRGSATSRCTGCRGRRLGAGCRGWIWRCVRERWAWKICAGRWRR
jgi:SAM-dependent methyltransferase